MWPAIVLTGTLLAASAAPSSSSTCSLTRNAEHWIGECTRLIEGTNGQLDVHAASKIVSGTWRRDRRPASVWSGTVATSEYPKTPVEVEIYGDKHGVLRTVFGWFPVTAFSHIGRAMRLEVDPSREVAPSSLDLDIIKRAAEILSDTSAWNRADDRKCPAAAKTWSIYCAMEKATIETAGAFHHRRPALEIVREIVDERTKDRPYDHRLMDYNNDPTTKLSDVQSLFSEAATRASAAMSAKP